MHFKKEKRERFDIFFNYEEYKVTFAYVGFEHSYNCRTNGFLGDLYWTLYWSHKNCQCKKFVREFTKEMKILNLSVDA